MAIKIILRESVDHLGGPGDIVNVAPGYARNYLLPKGLAFEATAGNMKMLQQKRKVWAARAAEERDAAQALADRIAALELSVTRKAGESGTLYGSVTNSDVADLLAARGIEIDRRRIVDHEPIKSIGTHEVALKLHREVTARFAVRVVAEDTPAETAAAAIEPAPETVAAEDAAPEAD